MVDTLERVISEDGSFFGVACTTTALVTEACRRHDTGPLAAAALGRALTGAVLLAALLKDRQSIMLRLEGNGPLEKIMAEAGCEGWVRGYVAHPHAELPLKEGLLDVAGGIGRAGFLTVTKNVGGKKYPGTIQLYTSEIGDDIAYYLTQSEQTPSALGLAIQLEPDTTISAAGGFLVQSLPPADEHFLTRIEEGIHRMGPLSQLLLAGNGPGAILAKLFAGVPHKKTGSIPLEYSCSCTREKMERALLSLGPEDIRDLISQEDGAEVYCEFCRNSYVFNKSELIRIAETAQAREK
jgi:molecular chaperone Hsp33